MKIRRMTARFGALDGRELELGGGFDIVTAPNESGKSTWCAFIRAMLYGIDSSQRAKAGVLPDKQRYIPWSGALPEGSMDIETRAGRITLRRSSASAASPMKRFSAVYTGTETPYPLTGTSAGEELTGVSRDVFTRSAFIGQGSVRIDNSPELEKRIAAIVASGEDSGHGYSEADARLREWQRARRYNARVGKNAELERRRAQLAEQLDSIASLERRLEEARAAAADAGSRKERAEAELAAVSERLERQNAEYSAGFAAVTEAEEAEREARRALDENRFGSKTPDEAAAEAEKAKARLAQLGGSVKPATGGALLVAALCAAVVSAALGAFDVISLPAALAVAAVCAALAVVGAVGSSRAVKAAAEAAAQRRALLESFGVSDEACLDELVREHARLYAEWSAAAGRVRSARAGAESRRSRASATELAETRAAAAAAAQRAENARRELSLLEGQSSVSGDGDELRAAIAAIDEAIAENDAQCSAIELARGLLAEADRRQLEQFSPALRHRASEIFEKLTAGRYGEVSLDRELRVSARLSGDTLGHDSLWLSEGARSLVYLSLRLAICSLALPEPDEVPIIIDDALAPLDDGRCAAVLEMLYDISRTRQVILFTCHSREAALLRGRPGVTVEDMPA